jgi:uncharacterized membrane protein
MFFLRGYAKLFFKTDDTGQRVFYPYGRFGKGYVVDSVPEKEIETYLRKWWFWFSGIILVQIVLQAVIGVGTTLLILAGPFLILWLTFHVGMRRRTKGLPRSADRMTTSDIVRNQAREMPAPLAYGLVLVGVVMTLASVFAALNSRGSTTWISAFGVLFFGYGLIHAIRIVIARREAN